ncbi:hypothetical protein ACFMPD_16020 [Sedimentitalea sp. HM32M-2]|uniref:hypothetical protein n=1 Tax=Sedimentitalea sp. HM32M-2 TaxID=3351566 RepID=UPI0036370D6A
MAIAANAQESANRANGPIPGDLSGIAGEWNCAPRPETPGYFKSLNGAEVADATRSQLYPCASFLGSMDGPDNVYAWHAGGSYQGVLFMANRYPGELHLTGATTRRPRAGAARTLGGQGGRDHRLGNPAHGPARRT